MPGRNTTLSDKHRAIISKDHPPCHWCDGEILYDADHKDPLAFQIDHVTPVSRGGSDTLDNLVPSHRKCNRKRSNTMPQDVGVTFVTERCWWVA